MKNKSRRVICLFLAHKFTYYANYSRKCEFCNKIKPGWGSKHLNPGDDFSRLKKLPFNTKVNPDDFRKKKR